MPPRRVKQRIHAAADCFNTPSSQPTTTTTTTTVVYYSGPDCFNKLSDDIITGRILPLLNFKERARTRLLSRRWRNLWGHTLGAALVFPHALEPCPRNIRQGLSPDLLFKLWQCRHNCRHDEKNCIPYINWVDCTLTSFPGTELDCFGVCYKLDSRFSLVVHRWLSRAVRLGVKKLYLHFGPFQEEEERGGPPPVNNYEFPSVGELSRLFHVDLNAYPGCTLGVSYLKELSLEFVNISGQTVDYLLSSCPLLESISLTKAACQYLKIAGPSLKLKYLQVIGCLPLEKLDISAPNLITLKYDGSKDALFLTSIPRLEHVAMSGMYFLQFCCTWRKHPLPHFGDYFYQLKTLEFEMTKWDLLKSTSFPLELPMLFRIEEVKVNIKAGRNYVYLWPCCLLKSTPRLRRFVVELRCKLKADFSGMGRDKLESENATMQEATKCKHPCLKVVEFVGFTGVGSEDVLARHLISCAEALEKLVFNFGFGSGFKIHTIPQHLSKYKSLLPPDAELVLI